MKFAAAALIGLLFSVVAAAQESGNEVNDRAAQQVERQATQPLNNAPVWREVRSGVPAETAVIGRETNVLIQPTMSLPGLPAVSAGEAWRLARPPLSTAGGAIIAFSLLALAGFYRWRGSISVHGKPTGRLIRRFSPAERLVHWTVAISFSVLGVTGLVMGLGKYVLMPVFGHTLFAWLADVSKALHNFTGPVFAVFVPVLIALFVRDNLPKAYDLEWLKTFGGMLSKEASDAPSGRFNAGEKLLFLALPCFFSVILVVTGFILDFPNFDQARRVMQQANLVHLIAALLGITVAFFHIYLGTIGQRGAYQAMRSGYVDEAWAKEHHSHWYADVKAGRSPQKFAGDVPAETRARVLQSIKENTR
jgi:formate dehydrogenase subunit gamma